VERRSASAYGVLTRMVGDNGCQMYRYCYWEKKMWSRFYYWNPFVGSGEICWADVQGSTPLSIVVWFKELSELCNMDLQSYFSPLLSSVLLPFSEAKDLVFLLLAFLGVLNFLVKCVCLEVNHCFDDLVRKLELTMVSLRRRRLLGLCSGNSSFVTPLPLYCENLSGFENSNQQAKTKSEQPGLSDDASNPDSNNAVQEEPGSSNASGSSSSKEQLIQQITGLFKSAYPINLWELADRSNLSMDGPPIKRRKRHRRKNLHNQEQCVMRGVYFKNMKWQAAIKVDKKQIHLGTVGSQEEAAHLYDRAAFMCGREPNFELPEDEKRELSKFKWDEFLAMTRQAITRKKHKRRLSPGPDNGHDILPLPKDDWDSKQGVIEDAEQETPVS
ncbi:Ethylene-responsive transcription factor-like protein isoform B, partial [Glycine soja]